MARHVFITILLVQMFVAVVFGAAGDTGETCKTSESETRCKSANDVCDENSCLIKSGQTCAGNTEKCVMHAGCDTTGTKTCKCFTGWAAVAAGTCEMSGAAGVTISLVLLMTAIVTSRFL